MRLLLSFGVKRGWIALARIERLVRERVAHINGVCDAVPPLLFPGYRSGIGLLAARAWKRSTALRRTDSIRTR